MSPRCRSCPATIRWVITSSGRKMPLDPMPVDDGNVLITDETLENLPVARVLLKNDTPPAGVVRYVSHFVTCPNAKEHRQ